VEAWDHDVRERLRIHRRDLAGPQLRRRLRLHLPLSRLVDGPLDLGFHHPQRQHRLRHLPAPQEHLQERYAETLEHGVLVTVLSSAFRELDRLTQQVFGSNGTLARPSVMPMDAWRDGDTFQVEFDLPGVNPDSIDLDVERNVVTVKAERPPRARDAELIASERPRGVFSRQLILGDNLDTEHIDASYDGGVLTLQIPVAEQAKPRKISISSKGDGDRQSINA